MFGLLREVDSYGLQKLHPPGFVVAKREIHRVGCGRGNRVGVNCLISEVDLIVVQHTKNLCRVVVPLGWCLSGNDEFPAGPFAA